MAHLSHCIFSLYLERETCFYGLSSICVAQTKMKNGFCVHYCKTKIVCTFSYFRPTKFCLLPHCSYTIPKLKEQRLLIKLKVLWKTHSISFLLNITFQSDTQLPHSYNRCWINLAEFLRFSSSFDSCISEFI